MEHSITLFILSSLLLTPVAAIAQTQPHSPTSTDSAKVAINSPSTALAPFTITLPAGQRFARLSFTDQQLGMGSAPVAFDLPATQVFLGLDRTAQAIATQTWIDETGTLWIELNAAVPPQTTLTIALHVKPTVAPTSHTYGIAAYPATANPVAVFVGDVGLAIP